MIRRVKSKAIVLDENTKLFGLVPGAQDKRIRDRVDYDYVEALERDLTSTDPEKARKAREALVWLNEFSDGHFGGRFQEESIFSEEQQKAISLERDAAKRDLSSDARTQWSHAPIEAYAAGALTMSALADRHRLDKREKLSQLRKGKKRKPSA